MLFKYLESTANAAIFANSVDINDKLRISKRILAPKNLLGLKLHEDFWSRTWSDEVTTCSNNCPILVDSKVSVMFTGPLTSHAQKIAKLEELLAIAKSDEGISILDGFPAGPNTSIELLGE